MTRQIELRLDILDTAGPTHIESQGQVVEKSTCYHRREHRPSRDMVMGDKPVTAPHIFETFGYSYGAVHKILQIEL